MPTAPQPQPGDFFIGTNNHDGDGVRRLYLMCKYGAGNYMYSIDVATGMMFDKAAIKVIAIIDVNLKDLVID